MSILVSQLSADITCPVSCRCSSMFTMVNVRCDSGSLSSLPTNIPTTTTNLRVSGDARHQNNIPTIGSTDLQELPSLLQLSVSFNGVTTISHFTFSPLQKLVRLYLNHNKINIVDGKTFDGLHKLEVLDLSGNQGCTINADSFEPMRSLKELYLGDMDLQTLSYNWFDGLPNLRLLDVHGNHLQRPHISESLLSLLPSLEHLDISTNNIVGLRTQTWHQIARIKRTYIEGNPWDCNCEILPLKHDVKLKYLSSQLVCNTPSKIQFSALMFVAETDLECQPAKILTCDHYSVKVKISDSEQIGCTIDGNPQPEVTLRSPSGSFYNSSESDQKHLFYQNGTFILNDVDASDIGQWVIKAENIAGWDQKNIEVKVISETTTPLASMRTTLITSPITTFDSKAFSKTPSKLNVFTTTIPTGSTQYSNSYKVRPQIDNDRNVSQFSDKRKLGIIVVASCGGFSLIVTSCIILVILCLKHKNNKVSASTVHLVI